MPTITSWVAGRKLLTRAGILKAQAQAVEANDLDGRRLPNNTRARVVHMVKMSRKTILKYLGAPPDQIGAELAAFTEAVKMAEIALGAWRMVGRR